MILFMKLSGLKYIVNMRYIYNKIYFSYKESNKAKELNNKILFFKYFYSMVESQRDLDRVFFLLRLRVNELF